MHYASRNLTLVSLAIYVLYLNKYYTKEKEEKGKEEKLAITINTNCCAV